MAVTSLDIRGAIRDLGLAREPLCVHSSLSSFGWVEGGAAAVVNALLSEECTLLVPTFSWTFAVAPPEGMRPARNGWDYELSPAPTPGSGRIYTPDSVEIDEDMGAVPAAVIHRPGRVRGDHPLCSFAAVGPLADELVSGQGPLDLSRPLETLAGLDGFVVLMGVGLTGMTLIHVAEKKAGRILFRRWANGRDGRPVEVEVGGCSDGFGNLEPVLSPITRETTVGKSSWRVVAARAALDAATDAIRSQPMITHCGNAECRCSDAVLGGPIL